jgi:hypothetical protein
VGSAVGGLLIARDTPPGSVGGGPRVPGVALIALGGAAAALAAHAGHLDPGVLAAGALWRGRPLRGWRLPKPQLPARLFLAAGLIAVAGSVGSVLVAAPPTPQAAQLSMYDVVLPLANAVVGGLVVARRWSLNRNDLRRQPWDARKKRQNWVDAWVTGARVAGLIFAQGVLVQVPNLVQGLSPLVAQPLKWGGFVTMAAVAVLGQKHLLSHHDRLRRAGWSAVIAALGLVVFQAPAPDTGTLLATWLGAGLAIVVGVSQEVAVNVLITQSGRRALEDSRRLKGEAHVEFWALALGLRVEAAAITRLGETTQFARDATVSWPMLLIRLRNPLQSALVWPAVAVPAYLAPHSGGALAAGLLALASAQVVITVWRDEPNRRVRERRDRAGLWALTPGRESRVPGDPDVPMGYRLLRMHASSLLADLRIAADTLDHRVEEAGEALDVVATPAVVQHRPMPRLPPPDARARVDDPLAQERAAFEAAWQRRRDLINVEIDRALEWVAYGAGVLRVRLERLRLGVDRGPGRKRRQRRRLRLIGALELVAPMLEGLPVGMPPSPSALTQARQRTREAAYERYATHLALIDGERRLVEAAAEAAAADADPDAYRALERLDRLRQYVEDRSRQAQRPARHHRDHHLAEAGDRLRGHAAYLLRTADSMDLERKGLAAAARAAAVEAVAWIDAVRADELTRALAAWPEGAMPTQELVRAVADGSVAARGRLADAPASASLRHGAQALERAEAFALDVDRRVRYAVELRLSAAALELGSTFARFAEAIRGPVHHRRRRRAHGGTHG